MLQLDEIRTRIEGRVTSLQGKLQGASAFADLVERQQLPQWDFGGFVLPGRLAGGAAQALSGMFVQDFSETVMVVLVTRVQGDPTGQKALDEITPLVREVVAAVCGWAPEGAPGIYQLASGELVGSQGGALIFQIDFSLNDQLRINPS